jgi:proteasome lid subunit RPN8/RPN11
MAQLTTPSILLRTEHHQEIITQAQADSPNETCGAILGNNHTSQSIIPVSNIAQRPEVSFLMKPKELLNIFMKIEEEDLEIVAFYHSHPHSAPVPSPTDLAQAYYPETPMIIIGYPNREWVLKAYYLNKENYTPVPLKIVP